MIGIIQDLEIMVMFNDGISCVVWLKLKYL